MGSKSKAAKASLLVISSLFLATSLVSMVETRAYLEPSTIHYIREGPSDIQPCMCVDDEGVAHLAWVSPVAAKNVFYANVSDGIISEAVQITDNGYENQYPDIAVDSVGKIHIFWESNEGGDYEIQHVAGVAGTFGSVMNLTSNSLQDARPSIAVDSNDVVHVVWARHIGVGDNWEIFYANDSAGVFSSGVQVTNRSPMDIWPNVAIDHAGAVHVTWYGPWSSTDEIYYLNNRGGAFGAIQRLTTDSSHDWYPEMAIDSLNHVHIVWMKNTTSGWEVFYINDAAGSFGAPVQITTNDRDDNYADIAIDSADTLHVIINGGNETDADIFYMNDAGSGWSSLAQLTFNDFHEFEPTIAVGENDVVHLAWRDPSLKIAYFFMADLPQAPVLSAISPNPSTTGRVVVDWGDVLNATGYKIYRHPSRITGLNSSVQLIAATGSSSYTDQISSNGTYHYVVVASNAQGSSDISNCVDVVVLISPVAPPPAIPGYSALMLCTCFLATVLAVIRHKHHPAGHDHPRVSSNDPHGKFLATCQVRPFL